MATRHAIGGDMGRLARQLLTETMVLALASGAVGLGLGWWLLKYVSSLNLTQLPRGYEIATRAAHSSPCSAPSFDSSPDLIRTQLGRP